MNFIKQTSSRIIEREKERVYKQQRYWQWVIEVKLYRRWRPFGWLPEKTWIQREKNTWADDFASSFCPWASKCCDLLPSFSRVSSGNECSSCKAWNVKVIMEYCKHIMFTLHITVYFNNRLTGFHWQCYCFQYLSFEVFVEFEPSEC